MYTVEVKISEDGVEEYAQTFKCKDRFDIYQELRYLAQGIESYDVEFNSAYADDDDEPVA